MLTVAVPNKELIRYYMEQRIKAHTPPPSQAEIRRQLGWDLIEAARTKHT